MLFVRFSRFRVRVFLLRVLLRVAEHGCLSISRRRTIQTRRRARESTIGGPRGGGGKRSGRVQHPIGHRCVIGDLCWDGGVHLTNGSHHHHRPRLYRRGFERGVEYFVGYDLREDVLLLLLLHGSIFVVCAGCHGWGLGGGWECWWWWW